MKLLVNETFQFRGVHREGTTITVAESFLKSEIEKGKHDLKKYGKERWISGLIEHCTPANGATADCISRLCGEDVAPAEDPSDEQDDSEEIKDLWAEFDKIGKACDKRWGLERLRNELKKAQKLAGDQEEAKIKQEAQLNKDFKIGD